MNGLLQKKWRDLIIAAVLDAADPVKCVESFFHNSKNIDISINKLRQKGYRRFHVISIGKAAVTMAQGLVKNTKNQIRGGVIVHKSDYEVTPDKWQAQFLIIGSSHPVPDDRSLQAANEVIRYLSKLNEDDFVYFLISGGGSALITLPEPGITLQEMMTMNKLLLECGANINEINCIRKHIDQVKGGKLITKTMPAGFCTLILSDVLGDPVDVIASGPTVPDNSTYGDAIDIIVKYDLQQRMPQSIFKYITDGTEGIHSETIKQQDISDSFQAPYIIGGNRNSLLAARKKAQELGFESIILSDRLVGEAKDAVLWVMQEAQKAIENYSDTHKRWCFLCGGETTVTIHGSGLGGRNLEMALAAVEIVSEIKNAYFVTFATDGEDGPTDAAGAWINSDTYAMASDMGLSVNMYLENNDSYHFFEKIGQLIKTGSSGTNVNDICFLIVEV